MLKKNPQKTTKNYGVNKRALQVAQECYKKAHKVDVKFGGSQDTANAADRGPVDSVLLGVSDREGSDGAWIRF
jgi:hypothetical protein